MIKQRKSFFPILYMGVSKNRGTPKWMVLMENPTKMDDLGVPPFKETPIWSLWRFFCWGSHTLQSPRGWEDCQDHVLCRQKKCALSLQVHEYVIYAYSVPRYIYIILYYMNMYNISTSLHKLKVLKKPWTSPKQLYGTTDCRGKKKHQQSTVSSACFPLAGIFNPVFKPFPIISLKMTMGIPNVFKMPASFLLIQLWAVAMFCKSWSSPLSSAGKKRDPNGII